MDERYLLSAKGALSLEAWGTAPRNRKRRRKQSAESAIQLSSSLIRIGSESRFQRWHSFG